MKTKSINFKFISPIILLLLLIFASTIVFFYSRSSGQATTLAADCTKEILAGESINKYSSIAVPGDVICIHAGAYSGTLSPLISGTSLNKITFKAYPGDECLGTYGGTKIGCKVIINANGGSGVSLFNTAKRSYIRIQGFEIINAVDAFYLSELSDTQAIFGIEIVNNYIHDITGSGLYARGTSTNNLLIENNEITNTGANAIWTGGKNYIIKANNIHHIGCDGICTGGTNFIVENNKFYDSFFSDCHEDAFDVDNAANWTIRYNILSDFTQLLYLGNDGGSVHNMNIYGNIFYDDKYPTVGGSSPGVSIGGGSGDILIYSNTFGFLGTEGRGIQIYDQAINVKVRNNIFQDTINNIEFSDMSQVSSDYNIYFGSRRSSNDITIAPFDGSHSRIIDPKFINYQKGASFDFHLQSTSPAKDTGVNLASIFSLPSPFFDIDGNIRPAGAGYDIGAYEYSSGTCTPTKTCANYPNQCGTFSDGCTNSLTCTCLSGYSCSNGQCLASCIPKTCSQLGKQCGTWPDGCTSTLNCGTCLSGTTCSTNGQCIASCVENWQCSAWSTCTSGIQTRTCTDLNGCGTIVSKPATQQTCTPIGCSLSSLSWQNQPTSTQTGTFRIEFDVTAKTSTMDMVFGLSNNPPLTYASLGPIVIFNNKGIIQARNSATYQADSVLAYTAGKTYHVGINISVSTKTYSVDITPSGLAKVQLAKNYAFRKEQSALSTINNFAFVEGYANSVGSNICNVKITSVIPEDFNADGKVDGGDLKIIAASFGTKTGDALYNSKCDLNEDSFIDVVDLQMFVAKLPK